MLYSKELKQFTGEFSQAVLGCLEEIKEFFSVEELSVLTFGSSYILVPVSYNVSIPPFGTIGGVDIRENEPVLILISLEHYPDQMPSIVSDRKDFPRKVLPHLYVSRNGAPSKLCLVRNNPNEWFAGKRMTDLLSVGEQWFYKAATGQLVDDGQEFDPLRLEYFSGYHSYKYEFLNEIVAKDLRFHPEYEMAFLFSSIDKNDGNRNFLIKSLAPITAINIKAMLDILRSAKSTPEKFPIAFPLVSVLLWSKDNVENQYDVYLPTDYAGLSKYFASRGINLPQVVNLYLQNGFLKGKYIPIVHAIQRPKKLVGYNGKNEFINFVIDASYFKDDQQPESAKVINQAHIEPFSKSLAEKMTGEKRNESIFFIGAGSLGSKIYMHCARGGNLNLGTLDDDNFLQHNLARHSLFQNKVGRNKAVAITEEADQFFSVDTKKNFKAFNSNLINLEINELINYKWLLDSSASLQVQNWLASTSLPNNLNVARCELVDDGRLGLMYIEGKDRNPRVDDLINLTYYYGRVDDDIKGWRIRDSEREVRNIDIGLGCSSTTTVMADDTISFHAATFSRVLYAEGESLAESGLIFKSVIELKGIPSISSKGHFIKPFEIYSCHAGSQWEIRFKNGLTQQLLNHCMKKSNIETGGILLGVANYKTQTIHVLEIIDEPQDSKGTCTGFNRGVNGLPDYVNTVKADTGGIIGYIGEWHTHPMDLERLSTRDELTITELVIMNRNVPIPTLAVIVTNQKVLPFVFE
ncbi:ThiF family adenylyltransferase [Rufibacter sp. LB8]|uniref:ThiF family adenylyltransferase n=1 Tax=Rufibacter sp. LB8 TaxID=2777781 RepID=UPI00178C21ED|nr:ThiF family adenylyltransferase [Rufibacter sp. LB8]